jgi:hypothetical protein
MVDEVDEKPPLTKEERRQRQKKLEQARRRQQSENVPAVPAPAGTEVGTEPGEAPAKRRGRPKRRLITASDLQGLKCFEKLAPLLERLHDVGCERDQAGNREFHIGSDCAPIRFARLKLQQNRPWLAANQPAKVRFKAHQLIFSAAVAFVSLSLERR